MKREGRYGGSVIQRRYGGGGEEVTEGSWLPNKDDRVVIGPGAVPCSHEKGTFLEADKDILMHLEGGDRCPGLRRDVFVVRVEEFCGKGEKMKTPVERGERERGGSYGWTSRWACRRCRWYTLRRQ